MPKKNPEHWTAEVVYWPYPRPKVLHTSDIHIVHLQGPLRALESHIREHQQTIRKVILEPPGMEDPSAQEYVDEVLEEKKAVISVHTLVVAPNYNLFTTWLYANGHDPHLVEYVGRYEQIAGNFKPIIVLNDGPAGTPDARHIMNLVNHPSRAGIVTRVTV